MDLSLPCCFDDAVRTLEGITLVTCVHIYLGADSAQGYLCPPVTVSVSFRFHSLCNAHSPLNCLERNIKWSSCITAACSLQNSSRHCVSGPHSRQTSVKSESSPRPTFKQNMDQDEINRVLIETKKDNTPRTSLKDYRTSSTHENTFIHFLAKY